MKKEDAIIFCAAALRFETPSKIFGLAALAAHKT
jgi:hypothetical protein